MTTGSVPPGMPVVLDRHVRQLADGTVLLGGDPGRLVRLRPAGVAALARLADGAPVTAVARVLARTLVDGGVAHPRPRPAPVVDLTVVVPVRDRSGELARCLAALGDAVPVVVVDDGSDDPSAVAAVCRRYGAVLVRRNVSGGPAAARNTGYAATRTSLVAFVDSDCQPPVCWLDALAGHFDDPACGAVAPRVRAGATTPNPPARTLPARTLLARYAVDRGPLDMGPHEAQVRPGGRVPYVPTAALLVRRSALESAHPFDETLRYGEDVDLVWRLHDAGWTVRYDPRTVVGHDEPERWPAWLARRHHYGTSAAPLSRRHGRRLSPLVLTPWPTTSWLLLLLGRPGTAALALGAAGWRLHRLLRRSGLPPRTSVAVAIRVAGQATVGAASGFGGPGSVVTAPVLLALLGFRRTRRSAAVGLLAPPLLEWLARRPGLDPVRWSLLRLVDDLAYATGVWRGCWSAGSADPLRPRRRRPV